MNRAARTDQVEFFVPIKGVGLVLEDTDLMYDEVIKQIRSSPRSVEEKIVEAKSRAVQIAKRELTRVVGLLEETHPHLQLLYLNPEALQLDDVDFDWEQLVAPEESHEATAHNKLNLTRLSMNLKRGTI